MISAKVKGEPFTALTFRGHGSVSSSPNYNLGAAIAQNDVKRDIGQQAVTHRNQLPTQLHKNTRILSQKRFARLRTRGTPQKKDSPVAHVQRLSGVRISLPLKHQKHYMERQDRTPSRLWDEPCQRSLAMLGICYASSDGCGCGHSQPHRNPT